MPTVLAGAFPEGTPVQEKASYHEITAERIGYRIPSQIGFAARGYRLSRCSMKFSGSMWLAGGILTLGYLWNRVRVQGGAYGAGFQIDRSGNLFSYSFRDPTPAKTLTADSGAAAYLREFAASGENLDKYIISALNELNPLLSPRDKGALADARILTGYTREESERIRQEVLNTTPAQLEACGEWLDYFAREGSVCVVAHGDAPAYCWYCCCALALALAQRNRKRITTQHLLLWAFLSSEQKAPGGSPIRKAWRKRRRKPASA